MEEAPDTIDAKEGGPRRLGGGEVSSLDTLLSKTGDLAVLPNEP